MNSEATTIQQMALNSERANAGVCADNASISEVADRFIEEHRRDYYSWQLLVFFAQHPYVRFNKLAVIYAVNHDDSRTQVQLALDELTSQGIIKVVQDSGTSLYSLAEDMRMLVLKLTGRI